MNAVVSDINGDVKKLAVRYRRSALELLVLNVSIPLLALLSIAICLLPAAGLAPIWAVIIANVVLTTQIAILTHELIHENSDRTRWNWPLRVNLHVYSPFTVGFAEYRRLHGLHHANANNEESDPDYFFIRGSRLRAFFALAFAPEYLFFYVLRKGETQPGFWLLHAVRLMVFAGYIYLLGIATFLLLFFLPAKLAWGIGFMFFSYESHVNDKGERVGNYNLEPRHAWLRFALKAMVGPYAYYVAFSHATHHDYPSISGRKLGVFNERLPSTVELSARHIRLGNSITL